MIFFIDYIFGLLKLTNICAGVLIVEHIKEEKRRGIRRKRKVGEMRYRNRDRKLERKGERAMYTFLFVCYGRNQEKKW